MIALVLGLGLFLGSHSVRIFAEDWRTSARTKFGPNTWRGLYSLVSVAGFILIVWGYGEARNTSETLWIPPPWTRHLAGVLTLPVFVLFAAAYVPKTRIKRAVKHPMVAGVKLWALAHLIANGAVADLLLFGSFLVWSIFDFRAARKRDRAEGTVYEAGPLSRDIICLGIGLALWFAFAFALHVRWIGVAPFGFTW